MKKVLIIINTGFVSYGGLTTVMMNYYRAIDKTNLQIDFASTNVVEENLYKELLDNGSKYFCLGDRKKILKYQINLFKVLKAGNYEVVHINGNSATMVVELLPSKICRVKKRIVHNHTARCNHQRLHRILYPIFKRLYTDAIACSKKAGEWIYRDGNFIVFNNGIDTEKYRFCLKQRKKIRDQYGIEDGCTLIGHVGKIYEPKNHPFLINIFRKITQLDTSAKLILVGDGEMRKQIESQVKELNIADKVIFAGMQNNIPAYLSAIDIFMFPSIWEGMPLSVIEAQASGLPCLISESIDKDVCISNSILRLPIDSSDVWVDAFIKTNIADRRFQSNENIQKIVEKNYDSRSVANKLKALYLE